MGPGVDAGVHADGDRDALAHGPGDAAHRFEFRLGLDVDLPDAGVERERDLARGLADPGKHDAAGGDAGGQGLPDFAFGDDVGSRTFLCQHCDDRRVRVRFHAVANRRR
jgi:hypothetical protein